MVLHVFQQHLNGLVAKVVGAVLVDQGVGLVNKEHAADGLLNDLLSFDGGLAYKAGHQAGAVHLHQLSLGQHSHAAVDLGQHPGHGSFTGAGVAQKDQMERHGRHREPGLLAQLAHLYQVNEALHVLFHLVQTAQAVQLLQQLFQRGLRLFLLGGFLLWRLLGGRLRFGDKLIGLQGRTVAGQAVLCTQSQQGVGAGVDKTGLRLADHIVHRGKQQ